MQNCIDAATNILLEATLQIGDVIAHSRVPSSEFVIESALIKKNQIPFADVLDPTAGAGGVGVSSLPEKKLDEFLRKNRLFSDAPLLKYYPLSLFLPKSSDLQKLSQELQRKNVASRGFMAPVDRRVLNDEIENLEAELLKRFGHIAYARTTEKYKILIDDASYAALPQNVIGSTSYDWSFHGGEGIVSSYLLAIGSSASAAKAALTAGLRKVKYQYVGSSMALKYMQRGAIGRGE